MSHFTVAVITPGPHKPDEEALRSALQPYHEYECTGTKDQYVVYVDQTDEARAQYESDTSTRYKDSEGILLEPYGKQFYRDPTKEETAKIGPIAGSGFGNGLSWHSSDWGDGKGYKTRIHCTAQELGMEEVQVPVKQLYTFREWAEDYYGYDALEPEEGDDPQRSHLKLAESGDVERVVRYTNPDKKWDWWCIGGRWGGLLQDRHGGTHDILQIKDLNVMDRMAVAMRKALNEWDRVRPQLEGLPPLNEFSHYIELHKTGQLPEGEDVRTAYWKQPMLQKIKEISPKKWDYDDEIDIATMAREDYGNMKACGDIGTFAYVKDGQWQQRGDMGWWGAHSEDMPKGAWERHWVEMILAADPESWITVVDCHI